MKVGDLVKGWRRGTGYIGLVVEVRSWECTVMINGGDLIDQLVKDLEVINESG